MLYRVFIILAVVILAVALLCFARFVYSTVAYTRLARAHRAPGTPYTVDGRIMHIDCTGEGTPTVILESGIGDDWLIWQAVQPELSEATRVCSYDRFGLGWSEPSSGPRDAVSIAAQLHTLLNVAKINGPLLLVEHSGGGLYIRAFTAIYPENVVGLVFVDATSTKLYQAIPEATETASQRRDRQCPRGQISRERQHSVPLASA
jgi:pimeloyl-ACP methyl ester carboxylesterase